MSNNHQFRKKLSEKEILSLNESQIKKIERVQYALERSEQAEANKEAQQKLRVLFQRAPPETLPFLVYCIYIGAIGISSFFYLITKFEGTVLYVLVGFLVFSLILPITILPKIHLKKFVFWLKDVNAVSKKNVVEKHR